MSKISLFRRFLAWVLFVCTLMTLTPLHSFATQESDLEKPDSVKADTKATVEPATVAQIRNALLSVTAPSGSIRYGNELVDLTGYLTYNGIKHTPLNFLTGRYYLAAQVDGKYYLFDGAYLPTNGVIKAYERTRSGNSLTTTRKENTLLFKFSSTNGNNDSDYGIRLGHGNYLRRANADLVLDTSTSKVSHTAWVWSTDEQRIIINDYVSPNRYNIALSDDKSSFGWKVCSYTDAHTDGTDYNRFYLFRYCYRIDSLYSAIVAMESYLDRPSGISDVMFQNFLESYRNAIALYNKYNTALTEELYLQSEYIQSQVDAMRNEILSYQLHLDSSQSYLDIPIQVLDFRADGFLFESSKTFSGPYSLSKDSPDVVLPDGTSMSRPGKQGWGINHTGSDTLNFFIEGLTEDYLVNGSIVYTPEVIAYIANALMYDTVAIPTPSVYRENWNANFLSKKNESGFVLGS